MKFLRMQSLNDPLLNTLFQTIAVVCGSATCWSISHSQYATSINVALGQMAVVALIGFALTIAWPKSSRYFATVSDLVVYFMGGMMGTLFLTAASGLLFPPISVLAYR